MAAPDWSSSCMAGVSCSRRGREIGGHKEPFNRGLDEYRLLVGHFSANMERHCSTASRTSPIDTRMAEATTIPEGEEGTMPAHADVVRKRSTTRLLEKAFGSPLPQAEEAMWAAMSPAQRASAIQRLKVLLLFDDEETVPKVDRAAADAGLSLNRWYEMHRDWRDNRSLASIGTSAVMPRSRTLAYHNDLLPLVVEVVDADPEASVRKLAMALDEVVGARLGLEPEDRPSYNTLRKFAEVEQRRRHREASPGNEVVFDCCACTLPHAEGVFVAYLILDRGTHAVLGAALGTAEASRLGYSNAAKDALGRIGRKPLTNLSWTEKLARSQLVPGVDEEAWRGIGQEMADVGGGGNFQLAQSRRRFGTYVRRLFGDRMGRVKFMPGKTAGGEAGAGATPNGRKRCAIPG